MYQHYFTQIDKCAVDLPYFKFSTCTSVEHLKLVIYFLLISLPPNCCTAIATLVQGEMYSELHVHSLQVPTDFISHIIMGSRVCSPYVGMAQFQDDSSNQCISIFTVISSPGNKCQCIKVHKAVYRACPSLQYSNSNKVANLKRSKVRIVHLLSSSNSLAP